MNTKNNLPQAEKQSEEESILDQLIHSARRLLPLEVPITCILVSPHKHSSHDQHLDYKPLFQSHFSLAQSTKYTLPPHLYLLAQGANATNKTRNATAHAEMIALDQIVLPLPPDTTCYVTLEPCIMCCCALKMAGCSRVVYGGTNARFGGCGGVLDLTGDECIGGIKLEKTKGVKETESIQLLQDFYLNENEAAPEEKRKIKGKRKFGEVNGDAIQS